MSAESGVQLGFSEPISESELSLIGHNSANWEEWDGGKIGGMPSWLNPKDLPKVMPLRCEACTRRNTRSNCESGEGTIMNFIAQIYSPANVDSGNPHAFHRSIYVFCCPHPECSSSPNAHQSVLVLRGQLSKVNEFYPVSCDDQIINAWRNHQSLTWKVNTCILCGQRASGRCPKSNRYFCGKEHQKMYHRSLKKKENCCMEKVDVSIYRFNETELVVEEEPSEQNSSQTTYDIEEINKNSFFSESLGAKSDEHLEQADLNELTGSNAGTSDPVTMEFYTRIGRDNGTVKGQCLRYNRWPADLTETNESETNDGPLWIRTDYRPKSSEDIPNCENCGARRKFEFQIMPQMINFLKHEKGCNVSNDSQSEALGRSNAVHGIAEEECSDISPRESHLDHGELASNQQGNSLFKNSTDEAFDFGTIVVFSCTKSCGEGIFDGPYGSYRREYAWRQKPL